MTILDWTRDERLGLADLFDSLARDRVARFSRQELIAQLRETAGSARRAPGAAPLDPLVDAIVHGQVAAAR